MKIVVIGATGTIGSAVAHALESRHEIVRASRNGSVTVDLSETRSIAEMFARVGRVDAVVCCAASAPLAALDSLSDEEFMLSVKSKLFGQVSLVRHAFDQLRDDGSVTLTSGVIPPMSGSAAGALVNAGLEAFVRAAALEAPRRIRLNVVCPGWVKETLAKLNLDDAGGTAVRDVAHAYVVAVEGSMHGHTIAPTTAGNRM